ncbi:efflux RND transporter periplasmic adaptor subunit [Dinoroseobacter sp. S124A]|uniref:efflux RND transporter periplasmic adaptor subunit n=1 Tax=Dinoroseobacter sp. S124A TaxID=3415128 RepID=UPI003C7A5795
MKLFSILTALVVVGALYALVFERDRVLTFAGVGSAPEMEDVAPNTSAAAPPPETDAPADGLRRVSVVALPSSAQTIDSAVILRGRTEASRQVAVSAEVSGKVISTPLRRGAQVTEGMALCELDRGTMEISLVEARARLVEAEINARAASELADGGFGSVTRRVAAEAALEAARAGVERAEESLADTMISAPFDGVLEEDTAELGAYLGPNSASGSHCATILQLDPIKIVGFVPELQVAKITTGALARAELSDGREFTGTVTFLSRSAEETTRTFRVEIEIANPDLSIRAGQTAGVGVAAEGAVAHLLPASALTLDDEGRLGVRHVVETDQGAEAAFAEVSVVRDTIDGVWLSGLPSEVKVIVVGQDFVTAGTPLEVTLREPEA